jgi:uncharacterized protein (DUF1330 family)
MPKGYWIVRANITDQNKYLAYVAANAGPFKKYGARFLVRAGEFPSYQAALDCWKSPEYQDAIKLRKPVSTLDLVIIEGYEGTQPG